MGSLICFRSQTNCVYTYSLLRFASFLRRQHTSSTICVFWSFYESFFDFFRMWNASCTISSLSLSFHTFQLRHKQRPSTRVIRHHVDPTLNVAKSTAKLPAPVFRTILDGHLTAVRNVLQATTVLPLRLVKTNAVSTLALDHVATLLLAKFSIITSFVRVLWVILAIPSVDANLRPSQVSGSCTYGCALTT